MSDFTKLLSRLEKTFEPSPWVAWAEQKQQARLQWLAEHTKDTAPDELDTVIKRLERFPITPYDIMAIAALDRCTYLPGSFEKRFARDMAALYKQDNPQITGRQRAWLWKQVYRYRRQIKDRELIAMAERITHDLP